MKNSTNNTALNGNNDDFDDFLASFHEDDLNYLVDRWAMKVRFCKAGDMKWGIYKAEKPR